MEVVMLHLWLSGDVMVDVVFIILTVILFVFTIVLNIIRASSITVDLISLIFYTIVTILDRLLLTVVLLLSRLLHHTTHITTILVLVETCHVDFPILELGGRFLVSAVLDRLHVVLSEIIIVQSRCHRGGLRWCDL